MIRPSFGTVPSIHDCTSALTSKDTSPAAPLSNRASTSGSNAPAQVDQEASSSPHGAVTRWTSSSAGALLDSSWSVTTADATSAEAGTRDRSNQSRDAVSERAAPPTSRCSAAPWGAAGS